ncbi:hypothetical protein OCU04_008016 [Sclerotinia nivalis]|uniref:Uncharacterized protein n=1 Tax=Sclerotinia nivalis TaxID=352851 RepID=A0A9X0AH85_9HELO|nr:hypothetical protein OCU04_008016 [Sclerotinia nivalis]
MTSFVAKQCPSVDTIEKWVKKNTKVGAKTVFHNEMVIVQNAKNYAAEVGGEFWGSVYSQSQFRHWIKECGEGDEQDKLLPRMHQALAQATTGQAYLMLAKGQAPAPGSYWMQHEWPALQGRVPVTAVNPSKVSETLANWTPDSNWNRDFEFDETAAQETPSLFRELLDGFYLCVELGLIFFSLYFVLMSFICVMDLMGYAAMTDWV